MRNVLAGVPRFLVRVTEGAAAILIAFIVCCNAAQIFCRYVLVSPLSWTDEAMRYAMVWVAFLAGSALVFRQEHMALNVIDMLKARWAVWLLRAFVLIMVIAFAYLLMRYGWPLAMRNAKQFSPSAQIPLVYAYIAVPVGGALMALYAAWLLIVPGSAPPVEHEEDILLENIEP